MKARRLSLLIVGLTVLGLTAGVLAGLLAARLPIGAQVTPTGPGGVPASLVDELHLTPAQAEQMRQIWEGVRDDVQDTFQQAQGLQKNRDDEIAALMTDEQKAKFEQISRKYAQQYRDLTQKREAAFEKAVADTKKLLDPEQVKRYEVLLAKRVGRGPTTVPASSGNL